MEENKEEIQPTASVLPESLPEAEPKRKKIFKILGYVSGVVFLVTLGAFGFWFYQEKITPVSTLPVISAPTPTSTPAQNYYIAEGVHKGWKKLVNQTYSYSIEFPANWLVKAEGARLNIETDIDSGQLLGPIPQPLKYTISIGEIKNPERKNLKGLVLDYPQEEEKEFISFSESKINSYKVFRTTDMPGMLAGLDLYFEGNNKTRYVNIALYPYNENEPHEQQDRVASVFDQALLTFKFLDKVSVPDDWKTYRNDEYGYEIRYPEKWKYQENVPVAPPSALGVVFSEAPLTEKPSLNIYIGNRIDGGCILDANTEYSLVKNINVSGYNATQYILKNEFSLMMGYPVFTLFKTDQHCVVINGQYKKETKDLFLDIQEKMLSTFKFLD